MQRILQPHDVPGSQRRDVRRARRAASVGARATDGRQRIMDIVPDGIHCRTGIFIGCKRDVENLNKIYAAWDAAGCPADWVADPLKMD